MQPLLWDTSIHGTASFRGHKLWSWKNTHIILVSVTSIKGTPPFREKGHIFWVPKPKFNLHSEDTLAVKTRLTTKRVDIFKFALMTDVEALIHKRNYLTIKINVI